MSSFFESHAYLLPYLTAAIGTGGFTVGLYSFIDPTAAARIYGIPVYNSGNEPSLTKFLGSGKVRETKVIDEASKKQNAFVHALGIRNFTAGLTILCLTSYWHFVLDAATAAAIVRTEFQRALGIVIMIGAFVPVIDAWVCLQHSQNVYRMRKTTKEQDSKSGNKTKNMWDGYDEDYEAYVTGRKAGLLHAARSLVWMLGGLWCLSV